MNERIKNIFCGAGKKCKEFLIEHKKSIQTFFLALAHAFVIYFCLETGNRNPYMNGITYTVINTISVFSVSSFLYLFLQRWWLSSLIMSVPLTVLSVANFYTLMFRNSPISTQDLYNAGTAMSVLDSYSFPMTGYVLGILIAFGLSVALVVLMFRMEKGKKLALKSILIRDLCFVACFGVFFNAVYFAENSIKPKTTFVWSWEDSYYKYGYVASSIEVFQTSMEMVTKPDNYSEDTLADRTNSKTPKTGERKPDIIFILNETFFDMRDIIDLGDTPSAMPFIDSLPETQKGRTVIAGTGGGTNKSEYELLTANTIQMMPGITPFNYLDFSDANSIVSFLESLGYSSWGAHCAESLNYSRNVAYPKLGFDKVLFDVDFGTKERYENRPYATDEFCYGKMLEDYENMGDAPRFMYMLTIQNHGNWDINNPEHDLITVEGNFGEYTDDISEFQSCMKLSDDAFRELTEYFEDSEREVIICMVGDHCPSFATNLLGEIDMDETFALRSTPYVLWANFDLEIETPITTSLPYLSPMVLEAAGCPVSPFYGYMNELRKDIPVLTAFGLYKTENGETYNYKDDTQYKKDIETYFDLVYNNAGSDAERIQSLFEAK